jgi:hypothetical protein
MKTPTTHDNTAVSQFLTGYTTLEELRQDYQEVDDILAGALALRTEGCNSTWSLAPSLLLAILAHCPVISVAAVQRLTGGSKAERTCRAYAQLARVASRALTPLAIREAANAPDGVPANVPGWLLAEMAALAALSEADSITATSKGALNETAPAAPLRYTPSPGRPCTPRSHAPEYGGWAKLKKARPGVFPILSKTACPFAEGVTQSAVLR